MRKNTRFRKLFVLPLLLCSFVLSSCGSEEVSSSEIINYTYSRTDDIWYVDNVQLLIGAYYGVEEPNKASLYLYNEYGRYSNDIPFDYHDFGIDYLAIGDLLDVTETNYYVVPVRQNAFLWAWGPMSERVITDVKVTHGKTVDLEVVEDYGEGTYLKPVDETITIDEYMTHYCICPDDTYVNVETFPVGTKVKGVYQNDGDVNTIIGLYNDNPDVHGSLEEKELREVFPWIDNILNDEMIRQIMYGEDTTSTKPFSTLQVSPSGIDRKNYYIYLRTAKLIFNSPNPKVESKEKLLTIMFTNKNGDRVDHSIIIRDNKIMVDGQYMMLNKPLPKFTSAYFWKCFTPSTAKTIRVTNVKTGEDASNEFAHLDYLRFMSFKEVDYCYLDRKDEYKNYRFENDDGYFLFTRTNELSFYNNNHICYQCCTIVNGVYFEQIKGS